MVARQPALAGQASPAAAGPGGGVPGEGADFLISRVVDTISKEVRSEEGLMKYLRAVMALRGSPYFAAVPTATRVRLQVGDYWGRARPRQPYCLGGFAVGRSLL